jgi:hypothetical protein
LTEIEPRPDFDDEISADVRYERGLAVKAAIAVALVLVVIVIRILLI